MGIPILILFLIDFDWFFFLIDFVEPVNPGQRIYGVFVYV